MQNQEHKNAIVKQTYPRGSSGSALRGDQYPWAGEFIKGGYLCRYAYACAGVLNEFAVRQIRKNYLFTTCC